MIYDAEIAELVRLAENTKLHLEYNHPQEAVNMLNTLKQKATDLQDEIESQL